MFAANLLKMNSSTRRVAASIDPSQRQVVIDNLLFIRDCVVATEKLLEEGADATLVLSPSSFHSALLQYFKKHLEEERGHLDWIERDLRAAGVQGRETCRYAMALVGTQYYLIKHVHPVALLGYMAVVEGDPVSIDVVEAIENEHGFEALTFLRAHAVTDLEHKKELERMIDSAPEALRPLIERSAENVLQYLIQASNSWGISARL